MVLFLYLGKMDLQSIECSVYFGVSYYDYEFLENDIPRKCIFDVVLMFEIVFSDFNFSSRSMLCDRNLLKI